MNLVPQLINVDYQKYDSGVEGSNHRMSHLDDLVIPFTKSAEPESRRLSVRIRLLGRQS